MDMRGVQSCIVWARWGFERLNGSLKLRRRKYFDIDAESEQCSGSISAVLKLEAQLLHCFGALATMLGTA